MPGTGYSETVVNRYGLCLHQALERNTNKIKMQFKGYNRRNTGHCKNKLVLFKHQGAVGIILLR